MHITLKCKQFVLCFVFGALSAVIASLAYNPTATLANTNAIILGLRYYFWLVGVLGAFLFGGVSITGFVSETLKEVVK